MAGQQGKIQWATGQQSSADPLTGAAPSSINVLFDAGGALHLRPGISPFADFAKSPLYAAVPVIGMADFNGSLVWVTSDRLIHELVSSGYAIDLSTASITTQLDGGKRPTFAQTRNFLAMAGAGVLQKWDGEATVSARVGGSPPPASHVVAMNQGLIVNVLGNTGQIQWSDTTLENWPGLNFIELADQPDPLPALYKNNGELIGGGTKTVQMMAPTTATVDNQGTLFFTYLTSRSFEFGFGAPYSCIQWDQQYAFLDEKKRFVQCDGRAFNVISDPYIKSTVQGLSVWSDCWGFRLEQASWNLLVWVFPAAGRVFCYDLANQFWGEWHGWNGGWTPWIGQSVTRWDDRGLNLVGLGDGTIGTFDFGSASEGGNPVVGEVVSGFQSYGTHNFKTCQALRLTFRRGIGASGTLVPPQCQLSWRDDLGPWQDPEFLSMGAADDVNPTIELRALGQYRERQWKIRMSDVVPLTLIQAEETYEVSDM